MSPLQNLSLPEIWPINHSFPEHSLRLHFFGGAMWRRGGEETCYNNYSKLKGFTLHTEYPSSALFTLVGGGEGPRTH